MAIDVAKLKEKVISVIAQVIGKEAKDIQPVQKIKDDIGVDQLDSVEIMMALEEDFSIVIEDEDAEKIITVEELIAYVHSKLEAKEEPTKKTDEEILSTEEDKLSEEEKTRKVDLLAKKVEDELLAKPEKDLTPEEIVTKAEILKKRENK